MEKHNIFPYYWYVDDEEKEFTCIRVYGLNDENKTICLKVNDFTPYVYLELPEHVKWTESKALLFGNRLDDLLGKVNRPLKKSLIMKYKLYGANIDESGNRKKFPYLFCSFSNKDNIKSVVWLSKKPIMVSNLGIIRFKVHEQDADPILQFTSSQNIPTSSWFCFMGKKVIESEKITYCENEYNVSFKNVKKIDKILVPNPKIMGFDIEVNSSIISAMPKSERPYDKIFQISCIFMKENENDLEQYLLSLGEPDQNIVGENVTIYMFETESELLEGFSELVRTENPNIIVGYNILCFDIPYMIDRAKNPCRCLDPFDRLGFTKYNRSKEKTIKWSSSAFKNQEFKFLDAEGRLFVDLLPLIKNNYKLDNYKLKTVSEFFLNDNKIDLAPKGIFKCYRIGTKKEIDGSYSKKAKIAMGKVGKYCMMDSVLVVKLMHVLNIWVGLTEQATTFNTPIFSIYTQGQQIKVYSQVYKYCMTNNIVVEKDGYIAKDDERYVGAHVFLPVPGIYDRVVPFDFCLTGDTLVTLSNGTSKRIDQMKHDELVLGFNGNGFQNFNFINGLQKKGLRETIKIYLQDGRTISCTPEHKFMLFDGTWCEAKDLKDKEVMCGIEYPEDIKYDKEKDWCLQVDGYKFTMDTDIEREKTLAFSRMLGYILSDGSIYTNISERSKLGYRMCSEACFGTMIDAENFKNDISKISDSNVNIIRIRKSDDEERRKKGVTLSINLPSNVARMIHSLEDIIIGKRFPKFVLNDDCPLSIIQHFLGGLYGGCHDNSFGYIIEFKWTISKKYLNSMKNTFENLKLLHSKLGIDSVICEPLLIKYKENSTIPKDYKENSIYDVKLLVKSNTFFNKINFHYCINRLTLSKNYSIKTEDTFIPSYKQKVIDIRPNGIQEVYDIEVDKVHNFLAGGIVTHNCSLYPSTIIAYNIDYSTLVTDESFPDSKCHVMVWPEHNSCIHDPKVIKKNELTAYINSEKEIIKKLREKRDKKMNKFCRQEIVDEINEKVDKLKPFIEQRSQITKTISKYPMCAERSYRFLKEPKGVLPTILENLLDARANTRKLIKKNNSEIKNLGDDNKVEELTLLNKVLDKRQLSYKISANSMYGAMGVKKGYLPFMPGAMCLNGDSLISYSFGFARKMKYLTHTDSLWAYNENGQIVSKGRGLIYNGKRDLVKITLIDGRILKCTPDHKIMTTNGWVEAGKLLSKHKWDESNFSNNSEYSKVVVGLELPEDIVGVDEKNWKLLDYTMDTSINREKTLAFCRVLGFILASGSIHSYLIKSDDKKLVSCKVYIGTLLDSQIFVNDIKLLTGQEPAISDIIKPNVKGNVIDIHVPKILVDKILLIGKRTHQPYTIPSFIFESNCPLAVVREFLGGLFGGDGISPSLSISNQSFSPIEFRISTVEKYKDDISETMSKLVIVLKRFDLIFWLREPRLSRVREEFLPKDIKENPIWEYVITTNSCNSLLFSQKIGFRYCLDKSNKLTVVASYQRYSDNVKKLQKYFTTARDYAKMIGCENWFSKESNKIYSSYKKESPCINLDVVDVRYDGVDDVYDIIDVPNNSFLANGIVVHNCTTFMGRTNIEIVADTIVEKYKGKLVYGDSVTGDTPILCKINNKIYYRTIETLGNNIWENYGTKEENIPDYIEVWTENGFTKIKKIIRHKTTKEIFRVLTHAGVVDVTEDHGLLDIYKKKVSPKEINIGDALLTSELPEVEISCCKLNTNLAFVMGMFYACGTCQYKNESYWAIITNRTKLIKCKQILNESDKKTDYEIDNIEFKIYVTIDSLKLVPFGKGIGNFVRIWRELFYDKDGYKKVPDEILWSTKEIRQSFWNGYCSEDNLDENYYSFDNKGKIGSSGLYFLATSLGHKISINTRQDNLNMYTLTYSKRKLLEEENIIKKIESLGFIEGYVYDLETENHHFSAGIGKLIVHNTDSNYINFPHLKTAEETWDYSEKVAEEISNLFPPPIKLAFEEVIYWRFFILSKKRYMYKSCLRDGVISDKVGKKGVLLARRDNSVFIRNLYEKIVMKIFNYEDRDDILYFILQELNRLCSNSIPHKDFVITKAIGDSNNLQPLDFIDENGKTKTKIGDYIVPKLSDDENERIEQFKKKDAVNEKEYYEKCLPAQMQLVEKMKRRGQIVQNGSRIEYIISNIDCHTDKQYEKIEHIDYFIEHSDILTIDFFYYLKNAVNSVDQVLNVAFSQNTNYKYPFKINFIKSQYEFRYNIRRKLIDSIKNLNKPNINFLK